MSPVRPWLLATVHPGCRLARVSQIHSCHHERALDSNVVRSVSLSSGSVSCGAALLPAALPVAGVAGALGSSLGGRGVARGAGVRVAWGGVEGGLSRSRFSLMQPIHALDDLRCTAPGANSCVDTGNLLPVQQSTSYNLDQVVAPPNSRRKVSTSPTIGKGTAALTEDMSPAPAAGTCRRSASTVHDQRQVSRNSLARSSGAGPGGRSGLVGGVPGLAAACLKILCSLVVPPGRHEVAPQSLGWARVCGTENSGVWVLKGDARTYNLPWNLDDVGVVWEQRSGYETARATPGQVCSCSYSYGRGAFLPQANPSVFTEAVHLWSRVAPLLTPWCAKGEVPTGVNLNRYAGDGSRIPWHCDNERLFGHPREPKVIVSMSLGHSAMFKLRRRAPENTHSQIRLDHGDLLVMDGCTQFEYEHSTASELLGPRVNLMSGGYHSTLGLAHLQA